MEHIFNGVIYVLYLRLFVNIPPIFHFVDIISMLYIPTFHLFSSNSHGITDAYLLDSYVENLKLDSNVEAFQSTLASN